MHDIMLAAFQKPIRGKVADTTPKGRNESKNRFVLWNHNRHDGGRMRRPADWECGASVCPAGPYDQHLWDSDITAGGESTPSRVRPDKLHGGVNTAG